VILYSLSILTIALWIVVAIHFFYWEYRQHKIRQEHRIYIYSVYSRTDRIIEYVDKLFL
jgi:hypothetical protein